MTNLIGAFLPFLGKSMSKTTELNAVNTMLQIIGEAPVNQIGEGYEESGEALALLQDTSSEVQEEGWYFNKEDLFITPDSEGKLQLPANTLKCDTSYRGIVQRGLRLYDRLNNTYLFPSGIKVTLTIMLAWDEIPEIAKRFTKIRAGRIFIDRKLGAANLRGFTREDEAMAYGRLKANEIESGNYNLFDNHQLQTMLDRSPSSSTLTVEQRLERSIYHR
jgi:hypothetical protein